MMRRPISAVILAAGTALIAAGVAMLANPPVGLVSAEHNQEIVPFEDFACLDCHTDQQRLTELAVVEEEPEEAALSSGPG